MKKLLNILKSIDKLVEKVFDSTTDEYIDITGEVI